ncbi:hypothetical protein U1Q18_023275 [Sarracenia purpurea var. burkii]
MAKRNPFSGISTSDQPVASRMGTSRTYSARHPPRLTVYAPTDPTSQWVSILALTSTGRGTARRAACNDEMSSNRETNEPL